MADYTAVFIDPLPAQIFACPMSVHISLERPGAPDVLALLAQSDAYMAALYPPESNHMLDAAALSQAHVRFFVARRVQAGPRTQSGTVALCHADGAAGMAQGAVVQGSGPALGCCALVMDGAGSGEIKRLFVSEAARGGGLGRQLLHRLEACAVQEGVHTLRLETGIYQPEALGLYESARYVRRGPFGAYLPDPYSVFMEKRLRD